LSPSPVKLQNLRAIGIPCLYKSYKIPQPQLRRVSFPAPAYRPVEGNWFFGCTPTCDLAKGYVRRRTRLELTCCMMQGPGLKNQGESTQIRY